MKDFHPTEWRFQHRNTEGQIIWASGIGDVLVDPGSPAHFELLGDQPWTPNALADEGESNILDVYFRGAAVPTNFYVGLLNSTPTDTTTLATMTNEPATGGYSRKLIERSSVGWPTLALDAGDYRAVSSVETFTATGAAIGPVTYAFLCTNAASGTAGLFLAYTVLTTSPRTINDGESLDVTTRVKLA